MGGLSGSAAFRLMPSVPCTTSGFPGSNCELDGKVAVRCLESLVSGRLWRFVAPPIDPDVKRLVSAPALPKPARLILSRIVKPAVAEIAHGKMGQVELCDGPFRRQGFRLIARHATAKEGELIAEWPAVFRRDLAGVVPPFGAKSSCAP